jgi:hypothetical protein
MFSRHRATSRLYTKCECGHVRSAAAFRGTADKVSRQGVAPSRLPTTRERFTESRRCIDRGMHGLTKPAGKRSRASDFVGLRECPAVCGISRLMRVLRDEAAN